jgi:hypothetical protein
MLPDTCRPCATAVSIGLSGLDVEREMVEREMVVRGVLADLQEAIAPSRGQDFDARRETVLRIELSEDENERKWISPKTAVDAILGPSSALL